MAKDGQSDRTASYPTLHILRCLSGFGIFAAHWGEPYHLVTLVQFQLTVDFFFFLEGFVAASYLGLARGFEQDPLDRVQLVYPLYLLGLLLGAATYITGGWPITAPDRVRVIVQGLLMWPSFTPLAQGAVFPLNPPSWAVALEFWAFVVLWVVRRWLTGLTLAALWAGSVAAMLVLAVGWHDINMGWEGRHYWGGPARMMAGFAGGLLLARLLPVLPRLPRPHPLIVIAAAIAVHFMRIRFVALPLLLVGVPLIVAAGAIASRPGWIDAVGRWARQDAYAIYLTHYPVMTFCHMVLAALAIPSAWSGSVIGFLGVATIVLLFAHLAARLAALAVRRRSNPRAAAGTPAAAP